MKEKLRNIGISLLIGMLMSLAVMAAAALIGGLRGGAAAALRWGRSAGLVLGAVSLIFAGLRLFSADRDGGRWFRPGRTALEMEAEVLDEHRRGEQAYRERGGVAERPKAISLWVAVGTVLAALLTELL